MKEITQHINHTNVQHAFQADEVLSPNSAISASQIAAGAGQTEINFQLFPSKKPLFGMTVEFTVAETGGSNPVTVVPTPWIVDKIEIRDGSNTLIQTLPSYALEKNLAISLDEDSFAKASHLYGYTPDWQSSIRCNLPASAVRRFYLPVLGACFGTGSGFPRHLIKGFWTVKLFVSASAAAGTGVLALSACTLRLHTAEVHADDLAEWAKTGLGKHWRGRFIDYVNSYTESRSITPGTQFKVLLQSFNGANAASDLYLTNSTSKVGNAMRQYLPLGVNALGEYLDETGNSLTQSLNYMLEKQVKSAPQEAGFWLRNRNVHPIIFGQLPDAVINGTLAGFVHEGGRNQLQVTPGIVQVQPVLTLTPSGTAASGLFSLQWRNPITEQTVATPQFAYSTSGANIQTALQALPNWPEFMTATVSGPLTAAATVTLNPNGSPMAYMLELIDVNSIIVLSNALTAGAAAVSVATTMTTAGYSGSVSGAVTLNVTPYISRQVEIGPNGEVNIITM
ncbi:MAG: hypothetical protein WC829_16880 [Hyphomicrobium sp.]|jgi:hypothetical protein